MPIYMKLDGLLGDATEAAHVNMIEVFSWSWRESKQISMGTSTSRTAGAVQMSDVEITLLANKTSPELFLACASGRVFKTAELFLANLDNAGKMVDYMRVLLTNAMISSYSVSSGGDRPMESLSLNFTKIEISYQPTDPKTNTLMAAIRAGWDLAMAKAV